MSNERLLTSKEFCELVGIKYPTFNQYVREGKIKVIHTSTGRIRVPYSEVERFLGIRQGSEIRAIIYARVLSKDQKEDLKKQIEDLNQYCIAKSYKVVDVLSDVGSGLNTERKGLMKLFEYVVNRKVDVAVITYKDRLTRFGFEYLEFFFKQYNVRIEAVLGEEPKDTYQEFVEDLMSIIKSFSGKLYGVRSQRKKKFVEGVKNLLKEVKEENGGIN